MVRCKPVAGLRQVGSVSGAHQAQPVQFAMQGRAADAQAPRRRRHIAVVQRKRPPDRPTLGLQQVRLD